jgi:hypothetical protein
MASLQEQRFDKAFMRQSKEMANRRPVAATVHEARSGPSNLTVVSERQAHLT